MRFYLQSNGGTPDPYVYEDDAIDTVVSRFLSLTSTLGVGVKAFWARLKPE